MGLPEQLRRNRGLRILMMAGGPRIPFPPRSASIVADRMTATGAHSASLSPCIHSEWRVAHPCISQPVPLPSGVPHPSRVFLRLGWDWPTLRPAQSSSARLSGPLRLRERLPVLQLPRIADVSQFRGFELGFPS